MKSSLENQSKMIQKWLETVISEKITRLGKIRDFDRSPSPPRKKSRSKSRPIPPYEAWA